MSSTIPSGGGNLPRSSTGRLGPLGLLLLLGGLLAWGLPLTPAQAQDAAPRQVEIRRADLMRPVRIGDQVAHRLLGHVVIAHGPTVMSCDSAYVFVARNDFNAYGHVVINSQGTVIYGDSLFYSGNEAQGNLRGAPVELHSDSSNFVLWTALLSFNTNTNTASYTVGGTLFADSLTTWSQCGLYSASTHTAILYRNVAVETSNTRLFSDSVRYERQSGLIRFWTPTRIYQDSLALYTTLGSFARPTGIVELLAPFRLQRSRYYVFGHRLHYERNRQYALAEQHVVAIDTKAYHRLYANKMEIFKAHDSLSVQREPLLVAIDTGQAHHDTLYLRADCLLAWRDTAAHRDTTGLPRIDSLRFARALGNVKAFQRSQQLIADSVYYNGRDSTATLFRHPTPFFWHNDMQASSVRMIAYQGRKQLDSIVLVDKVFIGFMDDSAHFNQLSGIRGVAEMHQGKFSTMRLNGDTQTLFFLRDGPDLVGINRVEAPRFQAWFKNGQPVNISFYRKPTSNVIPIRDAQTEDMTLFGFQWRNDLRPKGPKDIIPSWLTDLNFFLPLHKIATELATKDDTKPRIVLPATQYSGARAMQLLDAHSADQPIE